MGAEKKVGPIRKKKAVKAGAQKEKKPGTANNAAPESFPVVGLGASAGGLEALQDFFRGMPDKTPDMAFVVVSHLDPSQNSILPELIQKHTRLEVHQIEDGMEVQRNRVYVIPPNRDLQIAANKLMLTQISQSADQRAPINLFFRSLAEERGELAAGIVLSGMGSDGTAGLQVIKGELGVILVQNPDEAKYDGMPRAAINTGVADFVLPAGDMPMTLVEYFGRMLHEEHFRPESLELRTVKKIHAVLRNKSGHDFSHYKESTVRRRINRRLSVHGYDNPSDYLRYLQKHPEEIKALIKELCIGVTQFFRDLEAFEALKDTALPQLVSDRVDGRTIRAWVAGCATGEEAYSLAIILREYIDENELDLDFQIFATDLDEEAIERARTAVYSGDIVRDVSSGRLKKFFQKENHHYRIQPRIREKIVFAPHSVIKDPPFTRLDLLVCRNLLIYLDSEIQEKLMPLFQYSLNPGGILFLGHSETIGRFESHFDVVHGHWKIYQRKRDLPAATRQLDFSLASHRYYEKRRSPVKPASITQMAERALLDHFTPPAIVMDSSGEIRYIHGRVHKFLEHPQGAIHAYNAYDMAREGLKIHLLTTLRHMRPDSEDIKKVVRIGQDGQSLDVHVTISSLKEEEGRGLFVVMFEELSEEETWRPQPGSETDGDEDEPAEAQNLRAKLMICEEKLHTTVEELESTNEELRSSNEEYQSTNEELQSANEELNSSREELQSLNEELETVNSELQEKVRQVENAYQEMSNMLDSLNMPVIFLDKNLCIKRFSTHAHSIIEMIESDVGRPVKQLHAKTVNINLEEEALKVLLSETPVEKEVKTKDGKWHLMRVMPYPNQGSRDARGVVLSFVDISEFKELSGLLSNMEKEWRFAQGIVDTVREPLVVLDENMMVLSASHSFYEKFNVTREETEGRSLFDLGGGQWNNTELRRLLFEILPQRIVFNNFLVEHDFPGVGRRKVLLNARAVREKGVAQNCILLAIEDVTNKG